MSDWRDVRVLAVTLSRRVGGTDHSIRTLARALAPLGVEVTLGAPAGTETEEWWRGSDLPFLPLELPDRRGIKPYGESRLRSALSLFAQLPKSVETAGVLRNAMRGFDILHSNHLLLHADAVVAARLSRVPVVVEMHDIVPKGLGRIALSAVVSGAGSAAAVSNAVAAQVKTPRSRRPRVIHQGIDVSLFEPSSGRGPLRDALTSSVSDPLVAAVGRIDPQKNLEHLIEAVALLREQGTPAHLALIGDPSEDDGSYLTRLRVLAEDRLGSACRFLGRTDDVASVLNSIDVLACPSVDEPFGLIVLEAQACEVPVVVSDSGGLVDFVSDRRTGLIARTGDPVSLAAQLRCILVDEPLRNRMVAAASEQAMSSFTADRRASRFADLYASLSRD